MFHWLIIDVARYLALASAINNCTLIMRFVIITVLGLYLVGCASNPIPKPAPMPKKADDIILTTRGHGEEIQKDPD